MKLRFIKKTGAYCENGNHEICFILKKGKNWIRFGIYITCCCGEYEESYYAECSKKNIKLISGSDVFHKHYNAPETNIWKELKKEYFRIFGKD